MLKVIPPPPPPTTNCCFKSKCAEIHYQTPNFLILCIFCGMKTQSYGDFLEHFREQHFEDFAETLQSTAELIVTPIFDEERQNSTASIMKLRSHHDPLDFAGEREVAEDPEEVMKKLQQNQFDVKHLKSEELELQTAEETKAVSNPVENLRIVDEIVGRRLLVDDAEFNESDEEFLISKVKVEECDLQAAKPTKRRRAQKCLVRMKYEINRRGGEYMSQKPNDTPTTTMASDISVRFRMGENEEREDNDSDAASSQPPPVATGDEAETAPTEEDDIDWTKPYEPNLLRNHEKRPYKPRNKPNNCSYCGRTFRRRYQLDTHLNIHTGRKPHQCDICGRLFRAVTTLTRHLNTHEQREHFQCKFCTKAFTHKAALLSHELRHTQERCVPCDECDKFFYTHNQMDTHKRKVHHKSDDDNMAAAAVLCPLPFGCDLCTKRYRSASMLSTHKFKKHYKTAKFSCEQCGKKFIDARQLDGHKQLIHVDGLCTSSSSSKQSSQMLSEAPS